MYVPFGFPGFRPNERNCCPRYWTVFSSPGVPGARPSNSSEDSTRMCLIMPSAVMASSAGFRSSTGWEQLARHVTAAASKRRKDMIHC